MGLSKTCNTCKEMKSVKMFYVQKTGLLGRTGSCKECRLKKSKEYNSRKEIKEKRAKDRLKWPSAQYEYNQQKNKSFQKRNPDYWKNYYTQNREKRLEANKKFMKRNPIKKNCYDKYVYALFKGVIKRSEICLICGMKGKTVGHHFDYNKPLDVTWVCVECHKNIHRKRRIIKDENH